MPPPSRKTADTVNVEPKVASSFRGVLAGLGSKNSRLGYDKDWVAFREWLAEEEIEVLKVSAGDVKRYVGAMLEDGKSKATRARAISVLREVYRAFVEDGLTTTNPARETKNPKHGGTKRTPWLNEEELAKMLGWRGRETWEDQRDRLCVQLAAGLGWRRSEVARIRVEDVSGGVVRGILKGGKEGEATVPAWLLAEVAAWVERTAVASGPLLPRAPGSDEPISGDIVYNVVKRVGEEVGLPLDKVTPHALRRSLATIAEMRGVPLGDIQRSLGHESRTTTERYLKGSRRVQVAPGEWMAEIAKKREESDG